jgi:hypothetical protein
MMVHLIPAESSRADDIMSYAESAAEKGGAFEFKNLAPGKYWLLTRAAPDDEMINRPSTPVAWDPNGRTKLRREAMATKNEIELQPCARVKDFSLRANPH